MERAWDILDTYRGELFEGTWPSIPAMLDITIKRYPNNKAFTLFGPTPYQLTYAELALEIERVGAYLQELGVKQGDKVALNGKNSPAWALAYLAILYVGAVVVPLDNQLNATQICALGAFAEAKVFFADHEVLNKCSKDPWFTSLLGAINLDQNGQNDSPNIFSIKSETPFQRVETREDDLAGILFTSGTTGHEKGVMLTHGNFTSDAYQAGDREFLTIRDSDIFYALLPLHHSYAMTAVFLVALQYGCEIIFGPGMVISRILRDMREGKVTMFLAIPLLYNKLLAGLFKKVREKGLFAYLLIRTLLPINGFIRKVFKKNPGRKWFKALLEGIGFTHINICICGGGPLSPTTFKRFQQLGVDFLQGYGLTETAPILTLNPASHFKVKSVGKVFPLVEMRIADPDLLGVGEVEVKGPNICLGYYKDPQSTQELFTGDGFLKTGDLGSLDKENYLYLKGRAKNIIVTEGGKNVYPEEIEDAFQLYPQIEQILVRSYVENKALKSEGIEALIFPSSDYYPPGTEAKIINDEIEKIVSEVNRKLVAYKKISRITLVDNPMAMTSTKKIQRTKVGVTIGRLLNS